MNFALVRQIHPIMTLHTLETVFWLACVESNVASFMTVRSDLTASYVLIVIKHSSVRSVLILQNRFSRTRIKLDIAFWLTVFRVRVEITKQNKYSKVIWPCGFIPCCFGSSRCQVFFIFRLLFFSMFYWYWFDYLVCDTFCVFPFHTFYVSWLSYVWTMTVPDEGILEMYRSDWIIYLRIIRWCLHLYLYLLQLSVSDWLMFNAIFQLYHGGNKLMFNEIMMRSLVLDQHG